MADEDYNRKLTAIISADVVGYSRLMGDDESATVNTLKSHRQLITRKVQVFKGRVVDSPGDNILAEFGSIVDAVKCAVEIQEGLTEKNNELPENRKMIFRIGVNLGDVIQDGDRIYGDGVNIAARIESLADPGGVSISGTAFDNIRNKLDCGYQFIGEHSVKNISNPVRVYKVIAEPEFAGKVIGEKRFLGRLSRRAAIISILSLAIVTGGLISYYIYLHQAGRIEPASMEKMAYPLPEKPSIAVLPFVNMSEDPNQEYFSDGLTEEIITALSKVPKLFVIARNSVFTYKGKPVKVNQVAEELGIRYVLEGSIRKAGDKVRISAQLIDALSGVHLWAERYDRQLNEIFVIQDEITKSIITALQVKLTMGAEVRVAAKGTKSLEAYLKYLQANELINHMNPESNALAKQLAKEAIALDPEYASAYFCLGSSNALDVWLGVSKSPKQSIGYAMELLQKAIALDDTYAEAHGVLGFLYSMTKQHDKALFQAEKAVSLNPNSAECHYRLGKILTFASRWEESIPEYKRAIRLNPIPPNKYIFSLGIAYGFTGQYDEAIKWCEKAVHQEPDSLLARIMMTYVYSFAGMDAKARVEAAEIIRIQPKFSLKRFEKKITYKNKKDVERAVYALRKTGLK